jgi:hypothetical protein
MFKNNLTKAKLEKSNYKFTSFLYEYEEGLLNLNPEYQRNDVWKQEDKEKLLDSIFAQVPIGVITRSIKDINPNNKNKYIINIIDGKQRISTLIDFFLGKWKYKGYLFSELDHEDRMFLNQLTIPIIELNNATKEEEIESFIKLNTHGKLMEKEYIQKAKEMLDDIQNNKKE